MTVTAATRKAGELKELTTSTRGTKGIGAREVNVNEAWRAVGAEHGLTRDQAKGLFTGVDRGLVQSLRGEQGRDLGRELIGALTRERSTVSERDLHARAYELAVGWGPPEQADRVVKRSCSRGACAVAGRVVDDAGVARARAADVGARDRSAPRSVWRR